MFNVYVYYRIDPRHADEAEASIREMMARVRCQYPVTAQLLKKRDAPLLWMESYLGIADAESFLSELSSVVDEYAFGTFLEGERHVECFSDDAAC